MQYESSVRIFSIAELKKPLNMQKHTDDQVNSIDLVMTHLQIIRSKAYTIHDNRFFLQPEIK